jgi:putative ABC transport system ATP-binding protein
VTPVLTGENLTKHYHLGGQTIRAVSSISVTAGAGEVVVIQGPSGSGKSTLLNLLVGWEQPDHGDIRFEGAKVNPARLTWNDIAIVPQRLGLLPELTTAENVALPTRYKQTAADLEDMLARLALSGLEDTYPDELSQGQQQRVAVARAAIANPTVLVADEPTSSQDEESARLLLDNLIELAGHGTACVIASHDPIVSEYATRMIRVRDGTIQD